MHCHKYVCPVIEKYCSLHRLDGTCAYPGGSCLEVVEQCEGCPNIINNRCKIYPNPAAKWKSKSGCPRRRPRKRLSNLERKKIYGTYTKKAEEHRTSKTTVEKEEAKNTQEKSESPPKRRKVGRIKRFGIRNKRGKKEI